MKDVIAILRRSRARATYEALAKAGFFPLTTCNVLGRGKEGGLVYQPRPRPKADGLDKGGGIGFLPKKMCSLVVRDEKVLQVVEIILNVNHTNEIGDGKIFICNLEEIYRS